MGGQVHAWTRWEVQCMCHCARDTFTTLPCPEGPRNVNQSMCWRLERALPSITHRVTALHTVPFWDGLSQQHKLFTFTFTFTSIVCI